MPINAAHWRRLQLDARCRAIRSRSIRGWNRLEGRPRSADFERSLRAEVRDPLWFLTRQWQFGEFEGEDAARRSTRASRTHGAARHASRSAPAAAPTTRRRRSRSRVEREPVPFDLTLHMQAARYSSGCCASRPRRASLGLRRALSRSTTCRRSPAPMPTTRRLFDAGGAFLFDTRAADRRGARRHARRRRRRFAGLGAARPTSSSQRATALVDWFERTYGQPRTAVGLAARSARLCLRLRRRRRRARRLAAQTLTAAATSTGTPSTPCRATRSHTRPVQPGRSQSLSFLPTCDSLRRDAEPALLGDGERARPISATSTSTPTTSPSCCSRSSCCSLERLVPAPARARRRQLHAHRRSPRHRRVRRPDAGARRRSRRRRRLAALVDVPLERRRRDRARACCSRRR